MSGLAAGARPLERLRGDIQLVVRICRHPRAPWYVKLIAACCLGYNFSPVQLIPDWVPVLGLLDNLVVVSVGAVLLLRLTPPAVLTECRQRAATTLAPPGRRAAGTVVAGLMVSLWLAMAGVGIAGIVFLTHAVPW
ncbi:MAG: YkvA family protein [Ktedonobacterales bacterium]